MGAGYCSQRQLVREKGMLKSSVVLVEMARNVCILHFFLLQTVNGKAGRLGLLPIHLVLKLVVL